MAGLTRSWALRIWMWIKSAFDSAMKIFRYLILVSSILLVTCHHESERTSVTTQKPTLKINLDHVLALVDSVEINNQKLNFIWIYADAPTYDHIVAPGEGATCVDDVGRFLEVLEHSILVDHQTNLVPLSRGLVRFLLYMSLPDGRWYNFMWADGKINRERVNSRPEFSWWAVRGLRGLAAGYTIFTKLGIDAELCREIDYRVHAMDTHLDTILSRYGQFKPTLIGHQPAWLLNDASDQTSELLLALIKLQNSGGFDYRDAIEKFGKALVACQFQSDNHPLNGMYFCWNNVWHSWANNQALALMEANEITPQPEFRESVKMWAQHFVPFILANNFPHEIEMQPDSTFRVIPYPQIAYGINSSFRGIIAWNQEAGKESDPASAEKLFAWFDKGNVAGIRMYDSTSGRCFDGINNATDVNHNSGAESSIECLLAIQTGSAR